MENKSKLPAGIPAYSGPLVFKLMSPVARKAWAAAAHQRARCNNKNHNYYKYYGAKGVSVRYSTRDFVSWYIEKIKAFRGNNPTVGRIDHGGDYEFGNIEFQSREENSRESCIRNRESKRRAQFKPIKIINLVTGESTIAPSIVDAAKISGRCVGTISRHINRRISKRKVRTGPPLEISFVEL